jgi:hypothetical protein
VTVYPDLPPQRSLEHGGFEFFAPSGYRLEYYPGIVFITDPEQYLFVSLAGGYETDVVDMETVIAETIESLTEDMEELNSAEPVAVTVANRQGLAVTFQGTQDDVPIEGQLLYVLLENQQSFTMIGLGERELWLEQGQTLFTTLLAELAFFDATPLTDGCPVSRDSEYGYNPENPIRVASVVQDQIGPLADFYFEFLQGPQSESLEYTLIDTYTMENGELDVYEVMVEGTAESVTLYIDEFHAGQLMVPRGFSCQY